MDTPYAIVLRAEVTSTQDVARAVRGVEPGPVLVVAARQTAGRGRTGHDWQTAPRALACSLAFESRWDVDDLALVPLLAASAARRALGLSTGVAPALKWPNDLVSADGKVGGLLVEVAGSEVVVGCGANLWWPSPPQGYAGLLPDDPGDDVAQLIARRWADELVTEVRRPGAVWDREAYLAVCDTVGRRVTWEPGGEGLAIDVDTAGGLVVETHGGQVTLRSGSVSNVRDATLAGDSPSESIDP